MRNKFNVGDRVVALKEITGPARLVLGKVYTVEAVSPDGWVLLESKKHWYSPLNFKLLTDCIKVGSNVITSGYADIYDGKILTVSKRDKLGKNDKYCYFWESTDDSHNFNIEQVVRVIINPENTTILEPGQKVTVAGIEGIVFAFGTYISFDEHSYRIIFEKLFIENPEEYVSNIVGYKCTGLFPSVKNIEDLTKVYLALKAREKELDDAPKYYKFTSNESKPKFTKGKVYKIANPLNIEAIFNFVDDYDTPNGFPNENHKYFTPVTEEEWKKQKDCWKVVEKPDMPEESYVYKKDDIITFKSTDTELKVVSSGFNKWFCTSHAKGSNEYIFKALQIEDKYKFIKGVIGYEGSRGDFPVLKSAEDLTKVINALKEVDEKLHHRIGSYISCVSIAANPNIQNQGKEYRYEVYAFKVRKEVHKNTVNNLNIFDLSTDHITAEKPKAEYITDIFDL